MQKQERIEKWDYLKLLLIFLVVLGHICDRYASDSSTVKAVCFFIYTFHMPLFIFVSGMFSKKNIDQKRYKNIFSYFVLYCMIKMILSFSNAVLRGSYSFVLFTEGGVPWYAFALFAFNLIAIALRNFSGRYIFVASIVLACFTGYDDSISDFLVLSRIIVYFPFFWAGYLLNSNDVLKALSGKWVRAVSCVLLAGFMLVVYEKSDSIYWLRGLLTGRNPFSTLGDYRNYGAVLRLLYYPAVFLIGAAVIAVIPDKMRKWGTAAAALGGKTLQVYALHYPFITLFYEKLNADIWMKRILSEHPKLLVIPLAAFIIWVCSWKIWEPFFGRVLHPGSRGEKGMI